MSTPLLNHSPMIYGFYGRLKKICFTSADVQVNHNRNRTPTLHNVQFHKTAIMFRSVVTRRKASCIFQERQYFRKQEMSTLACETRSKQELLLRGRIFSQNEQILFVRSASLRRWGVGLDLFKRGLSSFNAHQFPLYVTTETVINIVWALSNEI